MDCIIFLIQKHNQLKEEESALDKIKDDEGDEEEFKQNIKKLQNLND